jgi:hypothetical protein
MVTTAEYMSQRHQQLQQQQQQQSQPTIDASSLAAQAALNIEDNLPVKTVQVAALVSNLTFFPTIDPPF